MSEQAGSFEVGIDFESVLRAISKQVYETPLVFIRENVQNAVDAIRIQSFRDGKRPDDGQYRIDVTTEGKQIVVRDNGIGMSQDDLQSFFWTIGASGKRTEEAAAAGCVGMFGIGGFANFGVCEALEVISQAAGGETGTLTRLSESDIKHAGGAIPHVTVERSARAGPQGTLVVGHLREVPKVDDLRTYLQDFVRFVPAAVYFNGTRLSQKQFATLDDQRNLTPVDLTNSDWSDGDLTIKGKLYEDRGHTLVARIDGLVIGEEPIEMRGQVRFENGSFDIYKHGFKLCATSVGTSIGVSGRLDCDRFTPTAGRDSLDAPSNSLLNRIALALERVAVGAVLASPERIGQHTRIFRYVLQHGLVAELTHVKVRLADGSERTLGSIRRAAEGGVGVFFGMAQKEALNQIMQARGHLVVLLSADRNRQRAERRYLEDFCQAKPFDGVIACQVHYEKLSRFEKVFLSELETNIAKAYEVENFRLIPGKLTEDIPVFVKESTGARGPDIFVDVRHPEIVKLEALGYGQFLYSLIATFARDYLGHALKKWSPRFFGDGALNLELLAKRRSEFWVLLRDDIGVVRRGGRREVVTRSDVHVVNVGGPASAVDAPTEGGSFPRILQIVEEQPTAGLQGFYIRLPDNAFKAYGDLLPECESRGVHWGGNRIQYVVSDTVSAAFQYEILLDEVVATEVAGEVRSEGAMPLNRPLQEIYEGLYFPIPKVLEQFLVPQGDDQIRLQLTCEWFDMRTAKHWTSKD